MSQLDGVEVNGHPTQRYAGNMNLSFAYVEGESLIMGLKVSFNPTAARTPISLEHYHSQSEEHTH